MRLSGQLLDIEHKPWTFTGDDGQERSGVTTILHVLDGREVIKVKVPRDGDHSDVSGLKAGTTIDVRVTVAANTGARGAYLTTTYAGPVSPAPAVRSA